MKNTLYILTSRIKTLFAPSAAYCEQDARQYLEKENIVTLSKSEVDFIDLETHRLMLRRRAQQLRQLRCGLPAAPCLGNHVYAVYIENNF